MECFGHVLNGEIVFDPPVLLPEGAKVRVLVESLGATPVDEGPTLYDRLRHLDGVVKDLPPDFAAQHDHYIHGSPKRDV